MATLTYETIATAVIGGGGTGFDFTSIPQTYTDLRIEFSAVSVSTGGYGIRINNNTSEIYNSLGLETSSVGITNQLMNNVGFLYFSGNTETSNTYANAFAIDFYDYANTSTQKTGILLFANDKNTLSSASVTAFWAWYFNTAGAITRIASTNATYADTIVTLYGIKREP